MSVLVYAENWEGKFKKATYEAVTYASDIAKAMGKDVVAVSIGNVDDSELGSLGNYGASKVLNVTNEKLTQNSLQAFATVLSEAIKSVSAEVVIFAHTFTAQAVAPRLAAKIDASYVAGVTQLPQMDSGFKVRRKAFSGKAFADVDLSGSVKILSLTLNAYTVTEVGGSASVESLAVDIPESDFACETKNVSKASAKLSVTEADIVVSAGRGLKGPENWGMIEELAELLGAATACSKPVSDADWRPHEEHVGQTGKTIGPNLYIAIGISGAIQHLAGVNSSKVIVVINKDPEAPFFKAADYGIVGDAFEVVPKLIESVKSFKGAVV